MLLSDVDIVIAMEEGSILIDPYHDEYLEPASYDMHLYPEVLLFAGGHEPFDIDDLEAQHFQRMEVPDIGLVIRPRDFVLVSTLERFKLGANMAALIDGSSTLSRSGFSVHQSGQWVDPGFDGQLTLECKCNNPNGFILKPGMKIGQLIFLETKTPARSPYNGRYQGQAGPMPPRSRSAERKERDVMKRLMGLEDDLTPIFSEEELEAING